MSSVEFGRRGRSAATAATPAPRGLAPKSQALRTLAPGPLQRSAAESVGEATPLARVPLVTFGLVLLVGVVFALEKTFAFDTGKGNAFSIPSLEAFGAIDYDHVVRLGEVWRICLAPLLHADAQHLMGNMVALGLVGWRLEPLIGRGWFAAIFAVGALGGVIGSLAYNAPDVPAIGASGAITGLIAALFLMSFHGTARGDRIKMLRLSLGFGVPALLPLAFGRTGHVDYHAHAGGAVAGLGVAVLLQLLWSEDAVRPAGDRAAAGIGAAGLCAAILSSGFAVWHYPAQAARAAELIPQAQMPIGPQDQIARSADLVARFPKDPRAHMFRALSLIAGKDVREAEGQLRQALNLTPPGPGSMLAPVRREARVLLAMVLAFEGRRSEAVPLVADLCGPAADLDKVRALLTKAKLCDGAAAR